MIHSWLLSQIEQNNADQTESSGTTDQFKQTTSKTSNEAEEITRINITLSASKFSSHDTFNFNFSMKSRTLDPSIEGPGPQRPGPLIILHMTH